MDVILPTTPGSSSIDFDHCVARFGYVILTCAIDLLLVQAEYSPISAEHKASNTEEN